MDKEKIFRLLRKYWYLVLLALCLLSAIVYIIHQSDKSPSELLREYGYFVILVWTFLEGETIVVIAGWASASMGMKPWLIALCAFAGSFCSDQVMFSLGKYKGKAVLSYFPRIAKNMDKAAALFKKYDTILILGFRFVYGVRNITPIMLGISEVSHKKFFFLNLIGASVWAIIFTYGGLLAGKTFMRLMSDIGYGILYLILGVILLAGTIWYLRARQAVKKSIEVAGRASQKTERG